MLVLALRPGLGLGLGLAGSDLGLGLGLEVAGLVNNTAISLLII